jgi:hypothetical protein
MALQSQRNGRNENAKAIARCFETKQGDQEGDQEEWMTEALETDRHGPQEWNLAWDYLPAQEQITKSYRLLSQNTLAKTSNEQTNKVP